MKGFACLEKQERLTQFEINEKKLKELVLSDSNPFPGYYSETPGDSKLTKPKFVFIALKQGEGCYEDNVLRAEYNIKKNVNYEFDANYGRITLYNKTKPCIRVKIDDLSKIPELIELFKIEGIAFQPAEKIIPYDSVIKIRKHITLTDFTEGVYSGEKENHYYIKIPQKLAWSEFVKLILSIKGAGNFGVFDAAQISLYLKNEIIEFIRIYTNSFKKEDFIKLKNEIIKRIQ